MTQLSETSTATLPAQHEELGVNLFKAGETFGP